MLQRESLDKLEIRLALFGTFGAFYTCTYANQFLPKNLDEAEKSWRAFLKRIKRWLREHGRNADVRYVYRIENKHGDGRWHLHVFLDVREIPPVIVQVLWQNGEVDVAKWNQRRLIKAKGYRGLAIYFTKEKPEVGKHRWGCARSLSREVPPCRISLQSSPNIRIPPGAIPLPADRLKVSKWGCYGYARYLDFRVKL